MESKLVKIKNSSVATVLMFFFFGSIDFQSLHWVSFKRRSCPIPHEMLLPFSFVPEHFSDFFFFGCEIVAGVVEVDKEKEKEPLNASMHLSFALPIGIALVYRKHATSNLLKFGCTASPWKLFLSNLLLESITLIRVSHFTNAALVFISNRKFADIHEWMKSPHINNVVL